MIAILISLVTKMFYLFYEVRRHFFVNFHPHVQFFLDCCVVSRDSIYIYTSDEQWFDYEHLL